MEYSLKQIAYKDVASYDNDYSKRSNDQTVPEDCHWYGVFCNAHLVAYFAVSDGPKGILFIRRGFVLPEFRSPTGFRGKLSNGGLIWQHSMSLLEQAAKKNGYKSVEFESERNLMAYMRMFKQIGYRPRYIGFTKSLED